MPWRRVRLPVLSRPMLEREDALRSEELEIQSYEFSEAQKEWDEDIPKPKLLIMNIYTKLLELQKKEIVVVKVGDNPHFKSNYATLNEVLGKIKKPLNDMGILILQAPEKDGLRTTLLDTESNTKVECFMPYVEATTAQKLGSNNTYCRRYSLVTLLGLEDEDDDGNEASGLGQAKTPLNAPSAIFKPGKSPNASEKQKKFIKDLLEEQGKPLPEQIWFDTLNITTAKAAIDKLLKEQGVFKNDLPTVKQ